MPGCAPIMVVILIFSLRVGGGGGGGGGTLKGDKNSLDNDTVVEFNCHLLDTHLCHLLKF